MEILESSFSGVTIDIFVFFFNRVLLYKRKFFDCNLSEKWSLYFMEKKQVRFFDLSQKVEISEPFQSISLLISPKKESFFQGRATSRKFLIGNLMEDFRLVVTKKKQFEGNVFTLSRASFGGIGKSEVQFKDRSIWWCNPVFLLKCIGFDWHSDRTKRNCVDLEQNHFECRDIILIKSTAWNFLKIKFLVWGSKLMVFQSNLLLQT